MKRLFVALAVLAALAQPAFAQKSKSVLGAEISSQFPNNTTGAITPSILRSVTGDFVNSWQQYPTVNAQTGTTYTFLAADYGAIVTFDNTAATAATLPTPTGSFGSGYNIYVRNKNSGAVTITPSGATINGAASVTISQNQSIWIVSDGNNYQVWNNSTGTITNVAISVPSSIFSVSGSPCTSTCALSVTTAGTSGGFPFFDSSSSLSSTAAQTQYGAIYGGGAGLPPAATSAGATGTLLRGGSPPAFTPTPTLGTAGSVVGTLGLAGVAVSTLSPTAVTTATISLPAGSSTLAALNLSDQLIAGGANVTALSQSTGSIGVDCGSRPLQYITNGGAFTVTAPTSDGSCILLVTNNGSAGAITFSGFSVGSNTGDSLSTTNTSKFSIHIWRVNGTAGYRIAAHQ